MVKLRKGVFETNSSSMHTLVMCNNTNVVTPEDVDAFANDPTSIKKGWVVWNDDHSGYYLTVDGDSFGQEFRLLTLWHAKLQYVLAQYGQEGSVMISNMLKEYIGPKFLGLLLTTDAADGYVDRECEARFTYIDFHYLDEAFGNVDHQSYGMITGAINVINPEDEKAGIKEVVFNNQYVIVIDGDGSDSLRDLMESGFMNEMSFTHILKETYERDPKTGKTNYDKKIISFEPVSEHFSNDDEETW